ncbi:MAG: DUF3987 domain-containing protein [Oscillospiraceae bacterium]|jgi:hypothetical protein|nr:DUF3987 domain-containing protein [Oscillospiraceae bacterium]
MTKKKKTNLNHESKIAVMVDPVTFKEKPSAKQVAGIKPRLLTEGVSYLTMGQIIDRIKAGHTICPGVLEGGAKAGNWISQQLFMVDIDNNANLPYLTPERAMEICKDNKLSLAFYYFSFSHSKDKPKFRLCFITDEIIKDETTRNNIMQTLISYFPQSDRSCKNADRFFYGTNKEVRILDLEARICLANFTHEFSLPDSATGHTRQNRSNRLLADLIRSFDFLDYLKKRNGKITSDSGNTVHFEDCEVCGHHDNLVYFKNTNTFYCYSPDGKQGGSIIDYLMITKNMDTAQATNYFINSLCETDNFLEWQPPVPFIEVASPPFPIKSLPTPLRDYVLAVAETTQTPVDMASVAILAVMAACLQGKFKIMGKPDWFEPLNIYCIIAANPGERKSPVMRHLTECLHEYEKQIKPLRLIADNSTPEALTTVLANNGGNLSIISSEGGIFDILGGAYNNRVNIDTLLKAHDGDLICVDRKGRETERIENPALTILLTVQPHVLNKFISNDIFRDRGLVARFLYSMPPSKVGTRRYKTKAIPQEVKDRYKKLCFKLLKIKAREPQLLTVNSNANRELEDFFNELEAKLKDDFEDIVDFASKLHGRSLRVAGILHIVKYGDAAQNKPISSQTVREAKEIGLYFLEHAKIIYRLSGGTTLQKQAIYILRQLKKYPEREYIPSAIKRICRGVFNRTEDIMPALDLLVEYGYLQERYVPYKQFGGRPPANKYVLNPLYFDE